MTESDRRREVRATLAFFEDLDQQLKAERGPYGQPSTNDFQVLDLFDIVERFATSFDDLPADPDNPSFRYLVATGKTVPAYVATGRLASDGAVELVALDLDVDLPWEDDD